MSEPIYTAVKCRIYPTKEQQVLINKHFGCTRFIYNWALGLKNQYYQENQKSLSRTELQKQLVAKKKQTEFDWLNEVNSQSLLSSLLHVDTAFGRFFKKQAQFPKFKSKKNQRNSYQCPQHCTVDVENGLLNLPKIKGIKAKITQEIEGTIKTVTISQSATGKYYASILIETTQTLPTPTTIEADKTLGIDLGLEHLLIMSDGEKVENPRYFKKSQNRLAIQQKKLARKKKESKNRQRQKLSVARIYERASNQRLNEHHQLTYNLICENQATSYAVEDLGIKNMVKNHKLAKSILDAAWGQFLTLLAYKAKRYGKNILEIGRFVPSSKMCSCCGYTAEKMPLSVRSWTCRDCDTAHDRDINAAVNIRNFALADVLGRSTV